MVMLRAILTTSSPLCSILCALSTAIFGKWSACKGRTRNQSILAVDELIVLHYRIRSIQDIIKSFGAPVLDTPGIILWSHVLQTVDLQAWEAAETMNYCLTAQSTVLDEAKRRVLLRCWRSVVKLDDYVSEFLVTEHVRSEPHDHGPSRYCAPEGSTTKHGGIKDKETRILPEVIKNFVKCNITKYVHLLQQDTAQGFWRPMLWIHGRIWLLSCGSSHLKKDKDGWLILSYQNINIQILFGRSHSKYLVIALPWLLVAITRPRSRTWEQGCSGQKRPSQWR